MKKLFMGLVIVLLGISSGCIDSIGDIESAVKSAGKSEYITKIGYVEDIEFIPETPSSFEKNTIIYFADGDVVVLQELEKAIPIHQNVTLHYHRLRSQYYLDNFTILSDEKKVK